MSEVWGYLWGAHFMSCTLLQNLLPPWSWSFSTGGRGQLQGLAEGPEWVGIRVCRGFWGQGAERVPGPQPAQGHKGLLSTCLYPPPSKPQWSPVSEGRIHLILPSGCFLDRTIPAPPSPAAPTSSPCQQMAVPSSQVLGPDISMLSLTSCLLACSILNLLASLVSSAFKRLS